MSKANLSHLVIRPATTGDAAGIAAVHVAGWRSAYAGLLPADYLAGLTEARHAAGHRAVIAAGHRVLVAEAEGRVVGFCSVGRPRRDGMGDGEVETLYVLDDMQGQGFGTALLRAGAALLAESGCGSVFLWVLDANPSRWFYERLGGRAGFRSMTQVAGQAFPQTAYVWDPVGLLTGEAAKR